MPLRAVILHNFWLKFFSLALATVIWMAIHYSIEHDFALRESDVKHLVAQKFLRIPVKIVATPGDSRLFKIIPPEVEVVALGEEPVLHSVSPRNIRVHVDLTDFQGRKANDVELHTDVPRDVTVISIHPPVVNVEQISQ
jgi:YbbR domain-containing protein